jgi:hypothetical protein
MNYHSTWLRMALENFEQDTSVVHSVNSEMTIGEFIEQYSEKDPEKILLLIQED